MVAQKPQLWVSSQPSRLARYSRSRARGVNDPAGPTRFDQTVPLAPIAPKQGALARSAQVGQALLTLAKRPLAPIAPKQGASSRSGICPGRPGAAQLRQALLSFAGHC
eukprot:39342-Chlamydomonas_euryale.AAC.1